MREKFVHPATVISVLALFVALSGTSYAVSRLPRNSVGGKQLRKNSVTAVKVKDGSLLAKDFKSGQLPKGQKGDTGAQGVPGEKGGKGDTGAPGPSEAITGTRPGFVTITSAGVGDLVGRLNLPAGSWVVTANTYLQNLDAVSVTSAVCTITVGTESTKQTTRLAPAAEGGYRETFSLTVAATLDTPGSAELRCATGIGVQSRAADTRMTAIRSGSVTDTGALGTS